MTTSRVAAALDMLPQADLGHGKHARVKGGGLKRRRVVVVPDLDPRAAEPAAWPGTEVVNT